MDGIIELLLFRRSYFAPEGNRYNLGRVPIGGTDFSTRPYTYDDRGKEPDVNLTHFALQPEDYKYKVKLKINTKTIAKFYNF